MKKILSLILIVTLLLTLASCSGKKESELKYVFLFIGDGMSFNAVQLARDANSARLEKQIPSELAFTDFDSVGVLTNYDRTSFIPDSASSGTSIATGIKTNTGMIAETASGAEADSIATLLKQKLGMKVGIITTANLNHATPGVFYAHSASRYNYHEIGTYLPHSDFDLFIGGEFLDPDLGGKGEHLIEIAEAGGYTVLDTKKEIESLDKSRKNIIIDPHCDSSGMMSFAIDRSSDAYSLADYLQIGIDTLTCDNGFFIMCEGGRIDSALHANDAATALGEVNAFSDAVDVALEFYKKHPSETLILVTGDHETGGLSLGYVGTGYNTHFEKLFSQKVSYLTFEKDCVDTYKAESTPFDSVLLDVEKLFGLTDMTEYEREQLKTAYDKTLSGSDSYTEGDALAYSTRTPLTVEVTRLAGRRAGVGFSTFVHTASPVGIWAKGKYEEAFAGTGDNTDVYNKLYSIFFK